MGGRVLDFEAKRIRDQGRNEGISIGEERSDARAAARYQAYEAQIADLEAQLAQVRMQLSGQSF